MKQNTNLIFHATSPSSQQAMIGPNTLAKRAT